MTKTVLHRLKSSTAPAVKHDLQSWLTCIGPLLDSLSANVFIASSALQVVFANQAARTTLRSIGPEIHRVFGVSTEEILGGSIHRFHRDPARVERVGWVGWVGTVRRVGRDFLPFQPLPRPLPAFQRVQPPLGGAKRSATRKRGEQAGDAAPEHRDRDAKQDERGETQEDVGAGFAEGIHQARRKAVRQPDAGADERHRQQVSRQQFDGERLACAERDGNRD